MTKSYHAWRFRTFHGLLLEITASEGDSARFFEASIDRIDWATGIGGFDFAPHAACRFHYDLPWPASSRNSFREVRSDLRFGKPHGSIAQSWAGLCGTLDAYVD